MSRAVFVTGGTGYIGRRLVPVLLKRGHQVRVLSRAASVSRVPVGATAVIGDVLDAAALTLLLAPDDTIPRLGRCGLWR